MKQSKRKQIPKRSELLLGRLLASGLCDRRNHIQPFAVQDDREAAEQQQRRRGSGEKDLRGKGDAAMPG